MPETKSTNLAKLDSLMRVKKSKKLKYVSLCSRYCGSYIRVKKYQEISLKIKASPKIILNPRRRLSLKQCRINPDEKVARMVAVPRILLRQPKYFPRFLTGIYSDIRLAQAGTEKAPRLVKKVTKIIIYWSNN